MSQLNGTPGPTNGVEELRNSLQSAALNGSLDVAAPRPCVFPCSYFLPARSKRSYSRRTSQHKRDKDAEKHSFMLPGRTTSRPPSPDLPSAPPSPHSFVPLLRLLTSNPSSFTIAHVRSAFHHMATEGGCTGAQVGAFLTALKMSAKDREADVVAACADVMRQLAITVDLRGEEGSVSEDEWTCDIVGTGGDGHDTFNVSTTAAIVAAGAGARVCKVLFPPPLVEQLRRTSAQHGNRASSSASGSADLLTSLNVPVADVPPQDIADLGHASRFLFLYAPLHHPSMALVGAIRRELGFPTIFNTLGPLINPARPDAMVLGVHSAYLGPIFAEALRLLGIKRAWVVCGEEGLDELSPEGATNVRSPPSALPKLKLSHRSGKFTMASCRSTSSPPSPLVCLHTLSLPSKVAHQLKMPRRYDPSSRTRCLKIRLSKPGSS